MASSHAPGSRLPAVDLLRGLVIALMALDHVRDFFSDALWWNITDPEKTTVPLFVTRWVTHFCAPVFVLLAGVGAALSEQRGLSKPQLARFLLIRGLWLVLLELTLVRHGFYFTFNLTEYQGLVIWVLGWSMVLLAGLQFLPRSLLLLWSLVLIFGHNLTDGVKPNELGQLSWLWKILHGGGGIQITETMYLYTPYRIIPWVGVMALGYCLGPAFQLPQPQRRHFFRQLGLFCILAFMALRFSNVYGDPVPWKTQHVFEMTFVSFLNCEKYPPSLCYLLMTLGPAFVALSIFDCEPGWLSRRLIVLGRVPLFFYLLHLPLIHGLAVTVSVVTNHGVVDVWLVSPPSQAAAPQGYGYSLPVVYMVWIGVLLILYPLCAWFGMQKRKHPGGWRSYL